jgi:uncharacterized membrane-anchored protein YhcB (DUF1043 family)
MEEFRRYTEAILDQRDREFRELKEHVTQEFDKIERQISEHYVTRVEFLAYKAIVDGIASDRTWAVRLVVGIIITALLGIVLATNTR